jgi:1,4-alpha-glucan branching enzyme
MMKRLPPHTARRVALELLAQRGSEVFVAGTFNDWNPRQLRLKDYSHGGMFRTTVAMPPGRHEYKFIVDGEWRIDANYPDWVVNDHGSLNSVINV